MSTTMILAALALVVVVTLIVSAAIFHGKVSVHFRMTGSDIDFSLGESSTMPTSGSERTPEM